MNKEYTITLTTGQLISIFTEKLSCKVSDVQKALDELTGDTIYTHQMPRAMRHVQPKLKQSFPWLCDLPYMPDTEGLEGKALEDTVYGWVDSVSEERGSQHEVAFAGADWVRRDPLAELTEILQEQEERDAR